MEPENKKNPIDELRAIVSDDGAFWAQPNTKETIHNLLKDLEEEHKKLVDQAEEAKKQQQVAKAEELTAKNEIESLKLTMAELQQKLDKLTNAHEETAKKNAILEEKQKAIASNDVKGKPVHLAIETPSLYDLNGDGWKIICEDMEKLKYHIEKGIVSASVLGDFDAGKSFLLNELGARFDSGYSKRTNAILISLPEEEGNYYGLVDTPGSKEAIQLYNEDLLNKLKKNLKGELFEEETPGTTDKITMKSEGQIAEEESKLHQNIYRYLHNDRKIIDNLKEKFIIENIDIIFIVVGKLSESESELIQRNVAYYEKVMNSNNTRLNKKNRNKRLYVIHNYKMLHTIDAVKAQMEVDIFKCFKVKKEPMFNHNPFPKDGPKYHDEYYKDSQGINHIVLAAKGSEAGNYFNIPALEFLKSRMLITDHKSHIDFPKEFLEFCQRNVPSMIQQQDLKLVYDETKKAIVNQDEVPIKIGRLYVTDIGDLHAADTYVPGYSKRLIETKESLEVILDVELLDCVCEAKWNKQGGRDYITIRGEKRVFDDATKKSDNAEAVNHSRLVGPVYISIPLLEDKDKPKIAKEDLKNGIWRFTLTYAKDDDVII